GYLSTTLDDIHGGLVENHSDEIEMDEVVAVLKRIQQFDPPGVAARDLQACLLLQLNQLAPDTPWLPQAKLLVSHYLNWLGNRDSPRLVRRSRLREDELRQVIRLTQNLNPKPGSSVADTKPEYLV